MLPRLTLVVLLCCLALPCQAAIFSDNFDSEAVGPNHNPFANWTVSNGTVDVKGPGFFDYLPGNGHYVDLDGSTDDEGKITHVVSSLAAGNYVLRFDLAGSQRPSNQNVHNPTVQTELVQLQLVGIGVNIANNYQLNTFDPFTTFAVPFTTSGLGNLTISFEGYAYVNAGIPGGTGGRFGDSEGMLLDDVVLDNAVPEPASLTLWGLGALGCAIAGYRRRKQVA